MIPIIITVRKQSERCKNKILREFYKTQNGASLSVLDVCLDKFRGNRNVYLAGYESEFKTIAKRYGVSFIQRTLESIESEKALIIHSHLRYTEFKYVCHLNSCCPFVKSSTVYDAIDTFEKSKVKSLFSVKESNELIFNSKKKLINEDRVFNSKIRKPNYVGNNAILIYDPDVFFTTGTYWTYTKNDPYLYTMDQLESIDIDTELDFKVAQSINQYQG